MNFFMSHITKILLRIIMMRVRNKIKPEIAGKRYNKCNPHPSIMIERALEVQKEVYLWFIDYMEAFDKV